MADVTQILLQIETGNAQAASELLPLVYGELKKLAAAKMATERADHTLQATALVHEAFLRLVGSANGDNWAGRAHFFSAAAEAMRRILIDHARNNKRLKRGSSAEQISLDSVELPWKSQLGDLLELNDALESLEAEDPRAAEIVKLRVFAGQTQAEAAVLMGVSVSTANRCWNFARAWLFRALKPAEPSTS
ncbi:MAG TPA: sigma-70 family RNA polymerase sigma factor [Planctomycetes bacterium]|nr:sigma-70 family RNA polymerase sigma factor [Fuerstiella sp.]HIK90543.1 sigma-70 family RNA polymerase sigma factor [Planctomycetota bacterium]